MLAAVCDAWNGQGQIGGSSWILASAFANHVPYYLLAAAGGAALLYHRYGISETVLRVAVWMLALCSFAVTVVGTGALLHRNLASTVGALGPYPDTMRATAGTEALIGVAVLMAADLVARGMQRAVATGQRPAAPVLSGESPRHT
jgi:hypothetical protein